MRDDKKMELYSRVGDSSSTFLEHRFRTTYSLKLSSECQIVLFVKSLNRYTRGSEYSSNFAINKAPIVIKIDAKRAVKSSVAAVIKGSWKNQLNRLFSPFFFCRGRT